jgi:hypothetical protein
MTSEYNSSTCFCRTLEVGIKFGFVILVTTKTLTDLKRFIHPFCFSVGWKVSRAPTFTCIQVLQVVVRMDGRQGGTETVL